MNTPNTTLAERLGTITRNIASGNNACGSLIDRQSGQLNHAFIVEAVRPTLDVYEGELTELRRERDALLRDVEIKRFALETAVANIPALTGNAGVVDAFRAALPGRRAPPASAGL